MKLYRLKNHNGRFLFETTEPSELAEEMLKYEGWTGNKTSIEVQDLPEPTPEPPAIHLV